jgi:ABC-type bacteriocin/lantibiotic exporter with double-glycine peptidase domain
VNTIAFGNLLQPLLVLSLVVVSVLGVSAVLQLLRFRVVELLQQRVFVRLASESVNRLLRARADALRLQNGPEVVNRFLDVVTVQKAGATLLVDGLSVAMQTLTGMALLAVYHPWLLAFDAAILAALLVVVFPLGSGAVHTAIGESKAKYALVGWLEEIARNATTFRGEAQARFAFERSDTLVQEYLRYRASHFRIVVRQFAGSLALQALASAALLGVGGTLVIQRQLTLGQLVAAELVVAAVLSGIAKFAKHLETFYDLLAALDKLGTLTDLAIEESGTEPASSAPAPAHLVVGTPEFTLDLTPGSKVGLVGPSGAGKSRLLDAICGYTEPRNGCIELDGCDLRTLRLHEVRSQVVMVRGIEIFHGSVLDNVRVGRDLSGSAVRQALVRVGMWQVVQELPKGVDAILATGGAPLSEGQKQALMFARAIAAQPRLLMIDEALDLVQDSDDREILTELLFDPAAPWTLILVTSRPELLQRCSRVLRLDTGGLKEAA